MASTFKRLNSDDVTTTRSSLHEQITLPAGIISVEDNAKSGSYKMFQSVYDADYATPSANPLFDISVGVTSGSIASTGHTYISPSEPSKRLNTYNSMAQIVLGYDSDGAIKKFVDKQGTSLDYNHMIFLSLSRLVAKDEVRRGYFSLTLDVGAHDAPGTKKIIITDEDSLSNYYVDSPTGDYGVLKVKSDVGSIMASGQANKEVGYIFYQAGVVALSTGVFAKYTSTAENTQIDQCIRGQLTTETLFTATETVREYLIKKDFFDLVNIVRDRIVTLSFHNTTELNSTIYFCRANHNEYNYSSNPTYIKDSKIVVKNSSYDSPVTYITTVGLYSVDEELLAVAKLSEPIKKTPDDSILLRVRLDV